MVRHLTYLDLTPTQRKTAATRVREAIRLAQANPFLDDDQLLALRVQSERITQWEHGLVAVGSSIRS
jgi:hypothetical protein